jgi:L-iditol 2-dehydrogenase
MKAAVYRGPKEIEIVDAQVPKIEAHEYLLKVTACGLCKTDVKKINGVTLGTKGLLKPPRVFGHEIVGEVAKIGAGIENFKIGDRVAVYHHVPCLECYYCLHGDYAQCETYRKVDTDAGIGEPSGGGFAEYVRVPRLVAERGTVKIPNYASDEVASLMEPTNCCLKGIRKAEIEIGDTVAVFGQGPVGLTLDQLAKMKNASVIAVDLVDYRLDKSRDFGADYTINSQIESPMDSTADLTSGRGVDVSIVAVESIKAVEQAIRITRRGGRVVFFAEHAEKVSEQLPGHVVDLIYGKEITVRGSYSSSFPDHQLAADLIFEGKIEVENMISHRFNLEKLMDAVELADKRKLESWEGESGEEVKESLKIIIKNGG